MLLILNYIDPGSGSLIFQALISGFLTIIVFYKKIIFFLKEKFGSSKKDVFNNKNSSN